MSLKRILFRVLYIFGAAAYILSALAILLSDINTVSAIHDANIGDTARDKLKGQTLYNLQAVVSKQLMPYIEREADEMVFIFDNMPGDKAYLQGVSMTEEEAEYLNAVPHDDRVVVLASDEKKPLEDTP